MIKPATEIEMMRVLHTFYVNKLISFEMVEQYLIVSTQLELTYLNESRFECESSDGLIKYKLGV
jgi:hypothetical protein